tara:strand:- start:317 stop:469 length:153 start_codon:yes stop_codon:yes gene_type:complete
MRQWLLRAQPVNLDFSLRAQHKKCGVGENRHAIAQREKRSLVQPEVPLDL